MATRSIGIVPPEGRAARAALFDGLELTLPVRFEARESGDWEGLDALVMVGSDPSLEYAAERSGLPCLIAGATERPPAPAEPARPVQLGTDAQLDRRLRGRRLEEALDGVTAGLELFSGDTVLARAEAGALWATRATSAAWIERVVVTPDELDPGESLRHRLRNGRFLALLALVHFLRRVSAEIAWTAPPPRACFLFDDPNLHWTSYGYLRFPELAAHAERHGYHVAMATVPMDHWYVHSRSAALFRERSDRLSLLFHGNNHALGELARPMAAAARRGLLGQALVRTARFEARTGIAVARVMAAPHGVCSEEMAGDMALLGFDGLCISRPYPWLARPPKSWLTRPDGTPPLAGWETANLVAGGLPVMLRRPFDEPAEELALRAFLDQPLILYGHHDDLAGGLDLLAERAAAIDALGGVEWQSFTKLARSNFSHRLEEDALSVRLFSRSIRVAVPDGVRELRVEVPPSHGEPRRERVVATTPDGSTRLRADGLPARLEIPPGLGELDVRLVHAAALEPGAALPQPAPLPGQVVRRLAGESKARLAPIYRANSVKRTMARFERRPPRSTARATSR